MKTKIKIKVLTEGCMPQISSNGDWIDLMSAEDITMPAPQSGILKSSTIDGVERKYRNVVTETHYIPLGIAIEMPEGYEAIIASRSSTPKKFNLMIPNGIGIIDNSYSGNNDELNYVCSSMGQTEIHKGDRICQMRIQLNQKATVLQKIKWLFNSGVELVKVDSLDNNDRGGLGSTNIN